MSEASTQLVMIHGLLGSMDYFEPAKFLRGVRVHTPELMGYGSRAGDGQVLSLLGQARFVVEYIERVVGGPVWLLGHSVGGAVSMLVAELAPSLVAGLISVEGNFTLQDAFWCGRIARLAESDWAAEFRALQLDPDAWLTESEIELTPERLAWARAILLHQPAATVQAMARAVVAETGAAAFLEGVRSVVLRGTPLHLLAGQRSAAGWDVPSWVLAAARSYVTMAGVGHMLMLEAPDAFCAAIQGMIRGG